MSDPMALWAADRLLVLMLALLLNALLGGPRALHRALLLHKPGEAFTALLKILERKLNRERRSVEERRRRGRVLVGVLIAASVAAGFGLRYVTAGLYYGNLVEVVIVAALLGLRQTADAATAVASHLAKGRTDLAREVLQGGVWRHAAVMEEHALARAAIENVAARSVSHVALPVMAYALFGLPGLLAARISVLLGDTLLHVQDSFGYAPARVQAALQYVPSLAYGAAASAGALMVPNTQPGKAWFALLYGVSELHAARREIMVYGAATGVALGGPASAYAPGAWIGGAVAKAGAADVKRAVLLYWAQNALLGLVVGCFALGG